MHLYYSNHKLISNKLLHWLPMGKSRCMCYAYILRIITLCLASLHFSLSAQQLEMAGGIKNLPDQFNNTYTEYSGLCAVDTNIYVIAESGHCILKYNIITRQITDVISIAGMDSNAELEAICFSGGRLYIADEHSYTVYEVVIGEHSTATITNSIKIYDENNQQLTGTNLLESITVSPDGHYFYIVLEHAPTSNDNTYLYTLTKNDTGNLKTINRVVLPLQNGERYADMYYSAGDNTLKMLRTSMVNYTLYSINVTGGIPSGNASLYAGFTKVADTCTAKGFSANLEGICFINGFYYAVSDNFQDSFKPTAFVKMKYVAQKDNNNTITGNAFIPDTLPGTETAGNYGCGANDYYKQKIATYPYFKSLYLFALDEARQLDTCGDNETIYITVYVHVVLKNGQTLITNADIQKQIDVLNADFKGLSATNERLSHIKSAFKNACAKDCNIRFAWSSSLRTDRNEAPRFTINLDEKPYKPGTQAIKFDSLGGSDVYAPGEGYLNIWIGDFDWANHGQKVLLGYSSAPVDESSYNGVVINYKAFMGTSAMPGFKLGHTLTHEVGHWLGLLHLWGNTDNEDCSGNDNCSDTPTQRKNNSGCPTAQTGDCPGANDGDMYMNFMDWTNDDCRFMFTTMQRAKMRQQFCTRGSRAPFTNRFNSFYTPSPSVKRKSLFTDGITSGFETEAIREATGGNTNRYERLTTNPVVPQIYSAVTEAPCGDSISNCSWVKITWRETEGAGNYYLKVTATNSGAVGFFITPQSSATVENLQPGELYSATLIAVGNSNVLSYESPPYLFTVPYIIKTINKTADFSVNQ